MIEDTSKLPEKKFARQKLALNGIRTQREEVCVPAPSFGNGKLALRGSPVSLERRKKFSFRENF